MINRRFALLAASIVCAASGHVFGGTIEAEGVALIEGGGIEFARKMALEDAAHQLSLQLGTTVTSAEQVASNGLITQSGTVRPVKQIERYDVLHEWNDGRNFHVIIRSDEREESAKRSVSQEYRKKVLFTAFPVQKNNAGGRGDLSGEIPRDLARRLAQSGKFQTRVSRYAIQMERDTRTLADISSVVRQLALENDSQFVVAGEVIDAGMNDEKGFWPTMKTRKFEVHVSLYDGLTGALIAQRHLSQAMDGYGVAEPNRSIENADSFSIDAGKTVDTVLSTIAAEVAADLAPLPFTARIVKVNNRQIVFDAGATSAIVPGDSLIAYQRKVEWEVGPAGQTFTNTIETPVGTVSVTQVQPLFSVGELSADPKLASLKTGDYVRFMSRH
jgi:hypothetical protein